MQTILPYNCVCCFSGSMYVYKSNARRHLPMTSGGEEEKILLSIQISFEKFRQPVKNLDSIP